LLITLFERANLQKKDEITKLYSFIFALSTFIYTFALIFQPKTASKSPKNSF